MKKRAKFNLVPSQSLLRYLQLAVYSPTGPRHVSVCNYYTTGRSPAQDLTRKSRKQRDESLSFLLDDTAASSEHYSRPDESKLHMQEALDQHQRYQETGVVRSEFQPVESRPDRVHVHRWMRRCKQLTNPKSLDFNELRQTIRVGQDRQYPFTNTIVKRLISKAVIHREFELALDLFRQYFEPSGSLHAQTISFALEASFRLHNHEECERIYAKYMDKIDFPLKTLHIVLKNFLSDYNFILAKQFFHQLTEVASEETLTIYLVGMSKLAHNPKELEEAFLKWVNKHGNASAKPYAVVLEGLLTLRANDEEEKFNRFYNTMIKRDETINMSPDIENVFIQRALMNQNQQDLLMHVNRLKRGNFELQNGPFLEALKFLCHQKNGDGVEFIISTLQQHNLPIDREFINVIGKSLHKRNVKFDLTEFLSQIESSCSTDMGTVELVWKILLHKYPHRGQSITAKLKKQLGRANPELLGKTSKLWVANKSESSDLRDSKFAPDSANRSSPLAVVRRIGRYNALNEPDKGVKELEHMIRKGAIPNEDIFISVLRGLFRARKPSEFDRICHLMVETGYDPLPVSVTIMLLRNELSQIAADNSMHDIVKRQAAITRIYQFCRETLNQDANLHLEDRCALAREYINLKEYKLAAELLDSDPDSYIAAETYDSYSLTGMLKCYRKMNNLDASVKLLNRLLQSPVSIPLYWHFYDEIRKSILQARFTKQYSIMFALEQQLYRTKQYRRQLVEEAEKTTQQVIELLRHGK